MSWGPFDLTGKTAIVTGSAMGIGFGIAIPHCSSDRIADVVAAIGSIDIVLGEIDR